MPKKRKLTKPAPEQHNKSPKHQYQPLPTTNHIRVLELLPGRDDEKICCALHFTDIGQAEGAFCAISYVWGDPAETVEVLCDQGTVHVTINLAGALRKLRDSKNSKLVWADAICINQSDAVEKGHQVSRMGQIFATAKEVLVWLGKDNDEIAKDCFDLVRATNSYLDAQFEKSNRLSDMPVVTSASPIFFDRSRWDNVRKLLQMAWFQRVWVIQEAAVARSCTVLWGDERIPIVQLFEFAMWLYTREDLRVGDIEVIHLVYMFQVSCSYDNKKTWRTSLPFLRYFREGLDVDGWSILHVLHAGRGFDATYDVDRVFAFLGNPLASYYGGKGIGGPALEADYSKSADEVYLDTACFFLNDPGQAAYVLPLVRHISPRNIDSETFPSWAPRWDKDCREYTVLSCPHYWYRAGGCGQSFRVQVERSSKSLLLTGILFDRIAWLTDTICADNFSLQADAWDPLFFEPQEPLIDHLWNRVVKELNGLPASPYKTTRELEVAFLMTLMLGLPGNDGPITRRTITTFTDALVTYRLAVRKLARSKQPANHTKLLDGEASEAAHLISSSIKVANCLRLCGTEAGRLALVPDKIPGWKAGDMVDSVQVYYTNVTPEGIRFDVTSFINGDLYIGGWDAIPEAVPNLATLVLPQASEIQAMIPVVKRYVNVDPDKELEYFDAGRCYRPTAIVKRPDHHKSGLGSVDQAQRAGVEARGSLADRRRVVHQYRPR